MSSLAAERRDPSLVSLGRAIRAARQERGISQEDLALMAGVDRSYMSRIERGLNNVAIGVLLRLTRTMEMSVAELMLDAGL